MTLTGAYIYNPSAALSIRGPDANSFLQGQFTNDLKRPIGAVVYGLWLNQKGKVVADSHVLRVAAEEFLVLSQHSAAAVIRQRLEDYIIADDVTVTDETADWRVLAVWGARANEISLQVFGGTPDHDTFGVDGRSRIFRGRYSAGENYSVLVPADLVDETLGRLVAAGCVPVDEATAESERISSGIPAVPADLGPGDLPNEGGLDASAISYTKGCYLGQEVMARLKNLGQVRRRLLVIAGAGPTPPRGTEIFQGAKRIGETRSAARRGDGFVAFALLSLVNFNCAAGLSRTPGGPADLQLVSNGSD